MFRHDALSSLVLGGPAAVLIGAFVLLPLLVVGLLSLFSFDPFTRELDFVGLSNYSRVLTSGALRQATVNTVVYVVLTVPVSAAVSLLVAVGIREVKHLQGLWRTAYFLPAASTLTAMSVVWRWMFFPDSGLIDSTVGRLFGIHDWLDSKALALPAMALIGNWQELGTLMVLFLAGLTAVPHGVQEAARLDGASAWTRFWHVSWPALRPTTAFALVVATRDALRAFDQIRVITDGGPVNSTTTLAYYQWLRGVHYLDIGGGSVVNLILLVLVLILAGIMLPSYWRRAMAAGAR
ncbi:carbohydrate ABC transporter permease [Nocardia sp. NPDC004711]